MRVIQNFQLDIIVFSFIFVWGAHLAISRFRDYVPLELITSKVSMLDPFSPYLFER